MKENKIRMDGKDAPGKRGMDENDDTSGSDTAY